jgi:hypothetical protein
MKTYRIFCEKNNIKQATTTNFDLINYAKQLKIKYFRGYFMNDELPKRMKVNECGIVNLQNSDQPGSHHVCYYNGSTKHRKDIYYFDPFGLEPTNEMLKYLKSSPTNKARVIMSTFKIQKFNTEICGALCIYVLYMLTHGNQFIDILLHLMTEINASSKTGGDLSDPVGGLADDIEAIDSIATIAELF